MILNIVTSNKRKKNKQKNKKKLDTIPKSASAKTWNRYWQRHALTPFSEARRPRTPTTWILSNLAIDYCDPGGNAPYDYITVLSETAPRRETNGPASRITTYSDDNFGCETY